MKALIQAVVVILIAALLGVAMTWNPLRLLAVAVAVVLGSAFFSCLSMTIAGIVLTRDRLMGIGQAITMPLFFASNALYPVAIMPGWLQTVSMINPLSYQVDALRGLLLGTHAHLALDYAVLVGSAVLGIAAASSLLGRLAADTTSPRHHCVRRSDPAPEANSPREPGVPLAWTWPSPPSGSPRPCPYGGTAVDAHTRRGHRRLLEPAGTDADRPYHRQPGLLRHRHRHRPRPRRTDRSPG